MSKNKIRKGHIKNNIRPKNEVKNSTKPLKSVDKRMIFDISFKGLFYFIDCSDFTNELENEGQFSQKFSEFIEFIHKVDNKDFYKELIQDSGMRHCHQIMEKYDDIKKYFIKSLETPISNIQERELYWDQLVGDEILYQIGYEKSFRCIGIYNETRNIFQILLFDWHHLLFPDKRKNRINPHKASYSLMKKIVRR